MLRIRWFWWFCPWAQPEIWQVTQVKSLSGYWHWFKLTQIRPTCSCCGLQTPLIRRLWQLPNLQTCCKTERLFLAQTHKTTLSFLKLIVQYKMSNTNSEWVSYRVHAADHMEVPSSSSLVQDITEDDEPAWRCGKVSLQENFLTS